MKSFDINSARDAFPGLKQDQIYLDNAGGSQILGTVIDSLHSYLTNTNSQLGGDYNASRASTALFEAGYAATAKYINASVDNIVLGASTTQLFRNLSYSLEFPTGAEIVISAVDHEANIAPWVTLAKRQQLILKWWKPQPSKNPKLLASDLDALLSEKTVLVTCTHASNVLGSIHNIKAIAAAVHAKSNALIAVDGVSYAPHRQIDVQDLGIDFYCFSWYKVYGPHMATLYASPLGFRAMNSLGHYFNPANTVVDKLSLAGASYELTACLPAILEYFGPNPTKSWAAIKKHEGILQSEFLTYLNGRSDVTIYGETDSDPSKRVSTISFTVKGWKSRDIVERVDQVTKGKIGIVWGEMYSNRLCEDVLGLGEDGIVRVSMVHYTSLDEVKQLIQVLDTLLGKA